MFKLPKRQHYIPQFYLKGFSQDKDHLWIYDRTKSDKGEFRYQTTKQIAFENNFYTHRTKAGDKSDLEKFFGQIETWTSQVILRVEQREKLSSEEREKLAIFISLMRTRGPSFKYWIEESYTKLTEKRMRMSFAMTPKHWLKKFYRERGKNLSDKEIDDLVEFATNEKRSKLVVRFPPGYWIKRMLQLSSDLIPVFYLMDWQFCYTKQKFAFITSDNPFLLIPSEKPHPFWGVGLITPGAKKILPLSSNICLVMHEPNKKPETWYSDITNKNFFRQINKWVVLNSERFSFSPVKGKLEKIIKETKPYLIKERKRVIVS